MISNKRINNIKESLVENEIDALIVTNGSNMKYLTSFAGGKGDGVVLVTMQKLYLITDMRYEEEFNPLKNDDFELVITNDYYQTTADIIKKMNINVVGFENDLEFKLFELLDEIVIADDFFAVNNLIEKIREIKDEQEIDALQKACDISIEAFNLTIKKIHPGMTELEISNELDYQARKLGAQKASFDTIVASGFRGVLPHGVASNKEVKDGELITIDFGYYVDGYTSDITRTIALGEISSEQKNIYQVVKKAQELVIDNVFNGVTSFELDNVGRKYITKSGYGKYFNHGMGHGVGLDIHEGPNISKVLQDEMVTNNLLTIEPGIYVPNVGGVRIEDDILVLASGYKNLTQKLTTDLIQI